MSDIDEKYKAMVAKGIIPPFRGKASNSDFGILGTYYIVYSLDNRHSDEEIISCTKEYIHYLKHWCSKDEGVQEEIAMLQKEIARLQEEIKIEEANMRSRKDDEDYFVEFEKQLQEKIEGKA